MQLPESGRVFVVSGRHQNELSQGLLSGRMNGTANRVGDPMASADRSAGHDSLETVADFRGRNTIEQTHSTSAFIGLTTPRLNSGTQSGRLNLTARDVTDESQQLNRSSNLQETEVPLNDTMNDPNTHPSEASTLIQNRTLNKSRDHREGNIC